MNFKPYIPVLLLASGVTFLLTPLVRLLSLKMGWMDYPDARRVNRKPMPRAGGIAIYVGFVVSLLFFAANAGISFHQVKFWGLLGSSFIIFLVGVADDTKGLSARRKLFYQLSAAMIASLAGFNIIRVSNPFGGHFDAPTLLGIGLTLFWIVGFTNAINLLDGLDGLAAGVGAIISGSLFFAAVKAGNPIVAVLSIALCGSALGFLPHNFYPAKIFMGDTGSMFLGFVISLISIEGAQKGATFVTFFVPIIAMGVPAIDTGIAILRRMIKGNKLFQPDKEHIHHQLLFQEGSQREAVVKLYFLTLCFGLIAIGLSGMQGIWAFIALIVTAIVTLRAVTNLGFLDFTKKKERT
ncbi:MAG: MraY family glycosyltransferase [Candidatus Omnitrophota bacterium]